VDINQCPSIANSENMCQVPSFAIYREGQKMKESLIKPTDNKLKEWVQDYYVTLSQIEGNED
jgi:hypothetical protein